MATSELVPYSKAEVVAHQQSEAINFMPVMAIQQAVERRDMVIAFTTKIMKKDLDYGIIPGSTKPCLYKAGAEKLCTFFGLVAEFTAIEVIEDWTGNKHGDEPLFYYRYRCRLSRNGMVIGEGEGSCSSWESKYRYRWVDESYILVNGMATAKLLKRGGRISEFEFAVDKAETTGKFGKPAEYWQRFKDAIANGTATKVDKKMKDARKPGWEIDSTQFRVSNPDIFDIINTCQKIGQKRALIAATLIGVNASEYFTQDLEDKIEADDPGPEDFGRGRDDEPPRSAAKAATVAATASVTTPSEPAQWDWQAAAPSFADLKAVLGDIRYAELLYKYGNGAKELLDLRNREHAKVVYAKIEAHLPKQKPTPAPPADSVPGPPEGHPILLVTAQALWARMATIKDGIDTFKWLLNDLADLTDDATASQHLIRALGSYGIGNVPSFKSLDQMKKCAKAFLETIQGIAQGKPATIPASITDAAKAAA